MDLKGLIAELKNSLNLQDVMEYYGIEFLSKAGDTWSARCYLHEDKVPSLKVSPRKGLFYCFSTGCTATGDLISFYQQFHNLEVYDAAKALAEEFGIDSSKFVEQSEDEKKKNKLLSIVASVMESCHKQLFKTKGALDYVHKRGVIGETLNLFKVGYCPSPAHAVTAAQKVGARSDEIKALGLLGHQFREKITFPIYHRGRPTAFYGGSMSRTDADAPKYVGPSGDNPLRQVGQMFGLQVARKEARQKGLILVEGFFDVLTLHSKGFKNTVGMLGSSPRAEQMEELSGCHVPSVTVLFDADRAGEAGVSKAIESRKGDVRLKVAFLPEGDPDEYVLKYGKEALAGIIDQAIGASDYLMSRYIDRLRDGELEERTHVIKELTALSSKLPALESSMMLKEMSEVAGVSIDELKEAAINDDEKKVVLHEAKVLSHCLRDEVCLMGAVQKFKNKDVWMSHKHRAIWKAIHELKARGVNEFNEELIKEATKGVHLNGTLDAMLHSDLSNFDFHTDVVWDSFTRRLLRKSGNRLVTLTNDRSRPVQEVLTEHLASLSKDVAPDSKVEYTASQQVESAMDYIHERMEQGGEIPGYGLGDDWKSLTQATLGLQGGYVYIISALPKVGKTTVSMNWCRSVCIDQKVPCLWLNFEMRQRDLALRFLSMMSGVSNTRLRMGAIGKPEKEKVDEAAQIYHQAPLHVVDAASMTLHEVVNVMRKYVYEHGVKIIFLDYIQLIRQSDGKMQYWEHYQKVSTELKSTISNLDVPLVAVSQLSKAGLEGGAAHQAGTFKFVQDADLVMELKRKSKEEINADAMSNLSLVLEYNRHGTSEAYINLYMDNETLRTQEA